MNPLRNNKLLRVFRLGNINAMTQTPNNALKITLCLLTLGSVASCARNYPDQQYWQRSNTSQSIYMHGPKAQQILHRDIQNCVFELKELERLHELDNPIPTTFDGYIKEADPETLYRIQGREGGVALLSGSNDYSNFDGCMYAKGWERIKNLPYSVTDTLNIRPRREKPDKNGLLSEPVRPPPMYDRDPAHYSRTND